MSRRAGRDQGIRLNSRNDRSNKTDRNNKGRGNGECSGSDRIGRDSKGRGNGECSGNDRIGEKNRGRKAAASGCAAKDRLQRAGERLLDVLYPPRCVLCDEVLRRGEHGCCRDCLAALPRIRGPVCMKCGGPAENERAEYCENCRTQEHWFDRGAAAFTYTGAMRQAVRRMKFSNRRDYIPFFAEAMAQALERWLPIWRPELILPVPMHPARRRRRGYNQAELLAERIGRMTGIQVKKDLLFCTRAVKPQKELGRRERLRNLRGSFGVQGAFPKGSRILLVDDVCTTGSTLDEISRVLRAHGADMLFFIVLCTGNGKKTVCTDNKMW